MVELEWYLLRAEASMCVGVLVWLGWSGICCGLKLRCVLEFWCGWVGVVSVLQAEAQLIFKIIF